MDSITQAVLGAAVGQATLKNKVGKAAPIAGALIATIPDLDVLLYAFYDGVEMLRIHRGFSHSFLGCLLGAVMLTFLLKQTRWFRTINFSRLFLFNASCLITHILLDYCTSYGTQLLLPFSDARLGLNTINVVDPVYTIPLLLGVLLGWLTPKWRQKRHKWNTIGMLVSTFYLMFTLLVKHSVAATFNSDLKNKHASYHQMLTMPVGAGSLKWYGVAVSDSLLYIKPYHLISSNNDTMLVLQRNQHLLDNYDAEWVKTMKWFSKGFYTVQQQADTVMFFNLQVDMRGVVHTVDFTAPTHGYFWSVPEKDGTYTHGSGTIASGELN